MGDLDELAAAVDQRKGRGPDVGPQPASGVPPVPGAAQRIWTVHDRGRQFGPHTEVEIAMLVGSGEVSPDALVWREGSPRWIPVSNIVPVVRRPLAGAVPSVVVNVNNVVPVVRARPTNGLGTAALVLGIISLVFICIPFVSIPFAALALVLGLIGVSIGSPRGGATAGIILSLIVMLLSALILAGIVSSAATRSGSRQTWQNP